MLLTVYWHLRSAQAVRERYGGSIWGNPKALDDVEDVVTEVIEDQVPSL